MPGRCLLLALALSASGCYGAAGVVLGLPRYTTDSGDALEIMLPMRDGARLETKVYLPEGKGPWPVIVIRNPYNFALGFAPLAKLWSRYGYVGVHQLVRGRAGSEGEWNPFMHERDDGLDTLRWVTEQPWSNGNLGLFGASYLSMVIWAMADALPPEVKTIVPAVWGSDVRKVAYEGGMFREDVTTMWAALMHDHTLDVWNAFNYRAALAHRPHVEVDEKFFGDPLPWYRQWINSQSADAPVWKMPELERFRTMPERTQVPALMISGWYDIFTAGQLEDFGRLASRDRSRLIVGPWTHLMGFDHWPDKELPNAGDIVGLTGRILNWFDHHLKGAPLDDWGPVETYAIGEGAWRRWATWPPKVETRTLYLDAAERSQACTGGELGAAPPQRASRASYVYDPRDPVPSRGGSGLLSFSVPGWSTALPSIRDQRGLCERTDVLTFTSAPLPAPLHILGAPRVQLSVSSSADDTAFTAKLVEVSPSGDVVNIQEGITSLAYRDGSGVPIGYRPYARVDVTITLPPVEWELRPGYRLRLDVSSSSFPAYHVHSNFAGPWAAQERARSARQIIYAGPAAESRVEVPAWTAPGTIAHGG